MLRFTKPLRGPYTLLRILLLYFLWCWCRERHSHYAEVGQQPFGSVMGVVGLVSW